MHRKSGIWTSIAGLVLLGSVYALAPAAVNAATGVVMLKGVGSDNRARVDNRGRVATDIGAKLQDGRLAVDAIGTVSAPHMQLISEGTSDSAGVSPGGVLRKVVIDNSSASPGTVVISANLTCEPQAPSSVVWQGTASAKAHTADDFDGGIFYCGPLSVSVTGDGIRYFIYGMSAARSTGP